MSKKDNRKKKRDERKDKRQDKKEQREKEGKKNIFQKSKDKINSFIDHPQNLIISAGLTPLKPYQPLMKNKLKKMGKPPGNNLAETTNNFVKYVMGINTFEDWQFENFQNASFTPNVEDLEFAENDEEKIAGATLTALIGLIPKIKDFLEKLKKKEPDLDDPKNPSPDINPDVQLDPADISILLPLAEDMKQYLAKAGQTYSNDPVENAIKIHKLTYPKKQTFEFENLSADLKKFWQNNKKEILSTVAALFVAVGTDPAPDRISQGIGKAVSSTQTAIDQEVKKQAKLKTYTPLLITAAVLAIILITKKK